MVRGNAGAMPTPSDMTSGLTSTSALSMMLTTESLLFAAFSVASGLADRSGRRVRRFAVRPEILGAGAVVMLVIVAAGAAAAWTDVFLSDFPSDPSQVVVAVALAVAILAQPLLAVLLGLSLRTRQ